MVLGILIEMLIRWVVMKLIISHQFFYYIL